jgi:hypothetical protein
MSYAKAVEGTTNDFVQDPAFHRKIQPPSRAEDQRRAGVPVILVPGINRPQIFSNPHPASPLADADLRGQSRITVNLAKQPALAVKKIQTQRVNQKTAQQKILAAAVNAFGRKSPLPSGYVKVRGKSAGLGDGELALPPNEIQTVQPINPAVVAAKVATGAPLTANEAAVWAALSPAARGMYTALPVTILTTQPATVQAKSSAPTPAYAAAAPVSLGFLDKLNAWLSSETISGIPNSYLVGGASAVVALAAIAARKRRR